ncbi:MAG: ABC transporter substrate-binding protein [Halanaerobacter sp.]
MKEQRRLLICLLLSILILFGGCTQPQEEPQREITDMFGRKVEVPQEVERVVAVGPGSLRLLTHMQVLNRVVGVEEGEERENWGEWGGPYNIAHPELDELPVIGPPHGGDAELILAQNPDLIFFYGDPGEAKSLEKKTGIPVLGIKYVDLGPSRDELLYEAWQLIGRVLNKEKRAQELIAYTEDLISDLKERTAGIEQEKRVYAGGISHQGGHGIVSTKIPFPPFEFLNLDYFSSQEEVKQVNSVMISKEKLVDWDPEIIFVDEMNRNLIERDLTNNSEYQTIEAIEDGEIYGILPYAYYNRNPSTILANTYYMGQVIYPEQFKDIDAEQKADEIYQEFVGGEVYDELAKSYGGYKKLNLN